MTALLRRLSQHRGTRAHPYGFARFFDPGAPRLPHVVSMLASSRQEGERSSKARGGRSMNVTNVLVALCSFLVLGGAIGFVVFVIVY